MTTKELTTTKELSLLENMKLNTYIKIKQLIDNYYDIIYNLLHNYTSNITLDQCIIMILTECKMLLYLHNKPNETILSILLQDKHNIIITVQKPNDINKLMIVFKNQIKCAIILYLELIMNTTEKKEEHILLMNDYIDRIKGASLMLYYLCDKPDKLVIEKLTELFL